MLIVPACKDGEIPIINIDERLEKLAERHEALTQSVELLLLNANKHDSNLDRMEKITESNSTSIGVLSRAVLLHEERLDRLEGDTAA